jgi:hypothetical protein
MKGNFKRYIDQITQNVIGLLNRDVATGGCGGCNTPNNSKSWSKLVKMENIWLKLVKVAARSNLAKVCQSLRQSW